MWNYKTLIILLLTVVDVRSYDYNILSIDGGGMKAMIPAYLIEKMEIYAYDKVTKTYEDFSATADLNLPEKKPINPCDQTFTEWMKYNTRDKKLPMWTLFDMTAGTASGSIVSGSLSYRNLD